VDNSRCDDGIACTVDVCDAHSDGGCDHRLDNAACDDGNTDTADVCTPEKGCVHTPLPDDGNACTVDTCDPATGVCTHTPVVCSDGDVCSNNTCDPATGCPPPGAGQCVDDGLFCNGQEECDPEQGCRHTGNPCLPDWQCDEDTRSCLSEFWSSFWQVRSPDATCTMIMLPTTLQPTIDDTDWALEARCHDSVIGYGQLTELTHVQTSAFEWPAPAIHPGMTGMTIYRVVGTVVSPTNAARYVSGLIAEYTIEGDAEPHRELAVLEEADSLSAALDLANRSTAESLPSNAAAATSCGLLFPTPGTIADCDTKTASCRKVVYAGYAVAASACVARQWSANLACLATCEEPPWLQCVATCGVPQFLAAICWAGVDVALNQGLQACDECGKACHCDYFLDQCPVNAPVGFHVTGLCPGDHVEMSGNCHRGNAQHDFDQDIEQGGSFVGHDIIELQCPVGTEWEVHSGPVLSHTHPQQEPRDCTPQGTSSGTVAVGSSNIPLFFCGDPNSVNSGTCDAPQVPRTIRGLVSSDVPIPGGIFVHLAANTGQNNPEVNLYRNADPTGNPAFEFPPMPDDTYWTLAVGFNNATQNADNECFFQGSGQGAISGRLEGADVNALIHCRGKSGFPVLVSVHNGTRSSFNYLTLFFNPDNGPTAGESYVYQDQIVRFGPIPDGTQYTLHVNQPTFNTAMKCQFENGQEDVHGQIHGAQAEHTILCTCTDSATDRRSSVTPSVPRSLGSLAEADCENPLDA